MESNTSAATL